MSDDLVSRLKRLARIARRALETNKCMSIWCADPDTLDAAATALTEARAEIERLRAERDEARGIVRDTHWMAVRYADGRMSYAPGMCNRAIQKAYDAGWLTYHDHKQHDHDPQYAREGDRPECRLIEARTLAAESELSTLRARVREVVGPFAEIAGSEAFQFQTREWRDLVIAKPTGVRLAFIQTDSFRAARQLKEDLK